MNTFGDFLKSVSVRDILLMVQSNVFNDNFLKVVWDHINTCIVMDGCNLESWEKKIYDMITSRIRTNDSRGVTTPDSQNWYLNELESQLTTTMTTNSSSRNNNKTVPRVDMAMGPSLNFPRASIRPNMSPMMQGKYGARVPIMGPISRPLQQMPLVNNNFDVYPNHFGHGLYPGFYNNNNLPPRGFNSQAVAGTRFNLPTQMNYSNSSSYSGGNQKIDKPIVISDDEEEEEVVNNLIGRGGVIDMYKNPTAGCSSMLSPGEKQAIQNNTCSANTLTSDKQRNKRKSNSTSDSDDDENVPIRKIRKINRVADGSSSDVQCNNININSNVFPDDGFDDVLGRLVYPSGGVENEQSEFKYFVKGTESEHFIRKFGLTARRLRFCFKPHENKEEPLVWLEKAVTEILDHATREFQPTDMVGVVIENEEFANKPIGISFRKLASLNSEVIMDVIAKVLQSNAKFFTDDCLSLRVEGVRLPVGNGFSAVDGKCVSFKQFSISKNSIFVIPSEMYCLAAALVVSKEFCDSGYNRNVLSKYKAKNGCLVLKRLALELCKKAHVDLSRGGNYNHIASFQRYLNHYTIVVYDSREGDSVLFEGQRDNNKPCLNLIFEDEHYNVILSLTAAFSAKYFCQRCHVKFSEKNRHLSCPFKCPCCHSETRCDKDIKLVKCNTCLRLFRGTRCFEFHKNSGLCSKLKRCGICDNVHWVKKNERHECNVKFCSTCGINKPIRHDCFMSEHKLTERQKGDMQMFLLIFYDFETMQEKVVGDDVFQHEVNLCVLQQVCSVCNKNNNIEENCINCGERQKIIRVNPVENFLAHVVKMSEKFKVTAVAHNMQAFDGCFLMQHIFKNVARWKPEVIRNGTKLLSITCKNSIRFIDSLNFIHLPLAQFSKSFGLKEVKGYFPHYFNRTANQNYIGKIPDVKYYGCETMKTSAREMFLNWYNEQVNNDVVFNMETELVKYCIADVNILRQGCLKFQQCFLETNNVDPLLECVTIAQACNVVFRRNFLKPETIGLLPKGGYRRCDKQSLIAIKWLLWEAETTGTNILHAGNSREVVLADKTTVDGYCRESKTVYEFYGCYWHGCERCYANQTGVLTDKQEAMFMRREKTTAKEDRIKRLGYNIITMWECDFRKMIEENLELKNFCENSYINKDIPLNPRDAFFGGRTNACKLYHKCEPGEVIKYLDVCSLYPFVNKYGKYPLGHPKRIYVGHDECSEVELNNFNGLIRCSVLPPRELYHPVLPYKCNGRLTFPLCRTCVETLNQNRCRHNQNKRQFVGTFVADELQKALELGYTVVKIYEIWEFDIEQYDSYRKFGGLFADYVNMFLKIKQEASGFPSWVKTEEDKDRYIREYELREGIKLEKSKICKNPGLRMLAKIMLNSFWGKFGQRNNLQTTEIIKDPARLFELLTNPSIDVHTITIINPKVLLVTWDRVIEDVTPLKTVNVVIAAYTTAAARLELYKYLEKLGRRVLYFDTDSVIFTQKEGDWEPPVGDFLGDLTDEMADFGPGSYIKEFVSGGPKNYAFRFWSSKDNEIKTVCKVKGLTLHYKNEQTVNFELIKSMVKGEHLETEVVLHDKTIARTSHYDVITKKSRKTYRVFYTKRRRLHNSYDTHPYGY